jgi:hypothetical protein
MWSRAWLQRRRTRSCYNTLLQELRAEDIDEYKNYMRMSKETFNMLLEKHTYKVTYSSKSAMYMLSLHFPPIPIKNFDRVNRVHLTKFLMENFDRVNGCQECNI